MELILADDGSTDSSLKFLEELKYKIPSHIKYMILPLSHQGVASTRNSAVSISQGEWLYFLDSDDSWDPEKLEKQIEFHQANPSIRISQTEEIWIRNGKFVNPKAKYKKTEGDIFLQSLDHCAITPSSVCIHRSLWNQTNGFDPRLKACEDYDLWIEIASQELVGLIPQKLITRYGGHSDQLSFQYPVMERFRIYSIGKRWIQFSSIQKKEAVSVLEGKLNILSIGLEKRKKDSKILNEMMDWVKSWEDQSQFTFPETWNSYLLDDSQWDS